MEKVYSSELSETWLNLSLDVNLKQILGNGSAQTMNKLPEILAFLHKTTQTFCLCILLTFHINN